VAAASQRITFTFDAEAFACLQRVKRGGSYKTMAEAVRGALAAADPGPAKKGAPGKRKAA